VRLSCLARNGRTEVPGALWRGVASPGEENLTAAIAVQAIEAQPAFGQIEPMRGQVLAGIEQHFEGDVRAIDRPTQEAPHSWRRNRRPSVQKGGSIVDEQTETSALASSHGVAVCRRVQPIQSKCEKAVMSRS
jgi:hypothetical protein